MKTLYYLQHVYSAEEFLKRIRNKNKAMNECEELYEDANIFLQGSCQLFAYALQEMFGYEIYEIKNQYRAGFHVYAQATVHNIPVFIDVRGITSNFHCFLQGLKYIDKQHYICQKYSGEKLEKDLLEEGAQFGYDFAKYIVKKYSKEYDAQNIEFSVKE